MGYKSQILEFLKGLPDWQIAIVLAALLVLAFFRKIRVMIFVGFIILFIWTITFFTTNRDILESMGAFYFGLFVGSCVIIMLVMIYSFFLKPK